jgi:hypothetical protein
MTGGTRRWGGAARAVRLAAAGCALAVAVPAGAALQDTDAPKSDEAPIDAKRAESAIDYRELTADHLRRIDLGLEWLVTQQREDGAFGAAIGTAAGTPEAHELACTGLAGLAFLAGGHLPGRGRYGRVLDRAIRYVVEQARQVRNGYLGDPNGRMYSHGFASLFLAEVVGVSDDPDLRERVREALGRAVQLVVATQDPNGGWWYHPNRNSGTNGADISVTVCQVMALRAAMQAGVRIDAGTIRRAVDLVKQACEKNGSFVYRIVGGRNHSGTGVPFPRSAAGVCMLYLLGQYEAEELRRGLHYLDRELAAKNGTYEGPEHFYYYALYYATIALYQWGGEAWERHFPRMRDDLFSRQREDGGWPPAFRASQRDVSSTAMALIALQVPKRYLPILKR